MASETKSDAAAEVLVVTRDDPSKSAKIKKAVFLGHGWRFADQRVTAIKFKTQGGLGPDDLMVNPKTKKVVSKKMHAAGTERMNMLRERGLAAQPFKKKDPSEAAAAAAPKKKAPAKKAKSPEVVPDDAMEEDDDSEVSEESSDSETETEDEAPPPPPPSPPKKKTKKATAGPPKAGKARARKPKA